jgi:hypothetical protein
MAAIEMVSVCGEQAAQKTPFKGAGSLEGVAQKGSESFKQKSLLGIGSGVLPIRGAPELI